MYILNIVSAIKNMTVKDLKNVIFESFYQRIGFAKENSYYSMKHQKKRFTIGCKKITRKNKEHYRSFLRNKNAKPVKR